MKKKVRGAHQDVRRIFSRPCNVLSPADFLVFFLHAHKPTTRNDYSFEQKKINKMEAQRLSHEHDDVEDVVLQPPPTAVATATEEGNIRRLHGAGPSAAASFTDARKRLMRDLKKMRDDPREGISAHPFKEDLMHWKAVIYGPEYTIWEGGIFKLELRFSAEYPMAPPVVKFLTPVFHPNVYRDGSICMDIMKSQWSPVYDVSALLLSIQSLLSDPNPNSAANGEAAELYAKQRREYDAKVQEIVEKSLDLADDDDDDDDDADDSAEANVQPSR